jgi:predicted DNA-binding transcriptional regulator AlpA
MTTDTQLDHTEVRERPRARTRDTYRSKVQRRPRVAPSVRLLDKQDILEITSVSFVTVWQWMRNKKFPRSRIVEGKSMWLSTEVDRWLADLPIRPLKGDELK